MNYKVKKSHLFKTILKFGWKYLKGVNSPAELYFEHIEVYKGKDENGIPSEYIEKCYMRINDGAICLKEPVVTVYYGEIYGDEIFQCRIKSTFDFLTLMRIFNFKNKHLRLNEDCNYHKITTYTGGQK